MLLIPLTVVLALLVGSIMGGSFRALGSFRIRWAWLAFVGVAIQFAPVSGTAAYVLLLASFVMLLIVAGANLRTPGFVLILTGLCLNAVVIVANHGMPVTREGLVRSGQAGSFADLVQRGGAKHHLAGAETRLLLLGDVVGVGRPIDQAVSVGDACVHLGIGWCIVVAMQPRRYPGLQAPAGSPNIM